MPKPDVKLHHRSTFKIGDGIPISLIPSGADPRNLLVLAWWFSNNSNRGSHRGILHGTPDGTTGVVTPVALAGVPEPLTFTPTGCGTHTVVVMIHDKSDPPPKLYTFVAGKPCTVNPKGSRRFTMRSHTFVVD